MSRYEQAADGAQNASTDAGSQGPPGGLPEAVPDFVGDIHSSIGEFLSGGVTGLGDIVSGIAGSGGADVAAVAADVALAMPV